MKTQRRQTGFTLIEMIAVIVILGILAAVALPRFMGMTAEARMAKMQGAVAAVNTAAALYHSKWLANPGAVALGQVIEGYALTAAPTHGYPAAADIGGLAGLNPNPDFTFTAATGTIADVNTATCAFTYTPPAADNGVPTVNNPNTLTTANCQ